MLSVDLIIIISYYRLKELLSIGKIFKYDLTDKHRINALTEIFNKIIW